MQHRKVTHFNVVEHLKSSIELVSNAYENSHCGYFNMGIIALQQKINGLPKGALTTITSTNDGNRLLAYQILINLLRQNISVLLFSNRLSSQDVMMHVISNVADIEIYKLASGKLNNNDWNSMANSVRNIQEFPLSIHDDFKTNCSVLSYLDTCEAPFSLIVIDDINILSCDEDRCFYETLYNYAKKNQSAVMLLSGNINDKAADTCEDSVDELIDLVLDVNCLDNQKNRKLEVRILRNRLISLNEKVNLSFLGSGTIMSSIRHDNFKEYECAQRKVVLNCETTGISASNGHRIIEIAVIELIGDEITGRQYHQYINPEIKMTDEVMAIHGISNELLADKPVFSDIVDEFISFINRDELIIHNAKFDVDHINSELKRDGRYGDIEKEYKVTDTMEMAKHRYPNEKMDMDSLCYLLDIKRLDDSLRDGISDCEDVAHLYLRLMNDVETILPNG